MKFYLQQLRHVSFKRWFGFTIWYSKIYWVEWWNRRSTWRKPMREFARIGKVRPGDILEADSGFDCMKEGERLVVRNQEGKLFVACKQGQHFLSGQESGHFYVGFYQVVK